MSPATASPTRLVFLDWLRILAFGLLVLYHVGMVYVSWDWHIKSAYASAALEPWMRLSSPWRLGLLFVVSGAATSLMLARRGADRALLAGRAKRLLLPLVFGMLVIVPPQTYLEVVHKLGYAGDYVDFMRLYLSAHRGFCVPDRSCLVVPTWNHLWFVAYLFVYTALLWALLRRWPAALDALASRLTGALAGAALIALPMLVLAVLRVALRQRFPPTHALVDDWFSHAQYGALFLLGAALARAPALWQRMLDSRWPALLLALAGWVLLVTVLASAGAAAAPTAMRVAHGVVYSVVQWCAIVAALGFARRHLDRDGAARRYLTEAVFPVYIVHQTLIVLLAHGLVQAQLAPAIEAPLLVAGTFVLSFAAFEAVRRVHWLRPWFGLGRAGRGAGSANAALPAPINSSWR